MRVTTKGQVTIPIEVRQKLGIFPGTEVEFSVRGDAVRIVKAKRKSGQLSRGEGIVERIRGKGSVNLDLTTDQLMALTRGWGQDDFDR
ncbi:MAG: AbrB/MazE/SpoVT family DNA-binding domain-containing protein [Pyrinomonadaceae bacterium]